MDRSGRRETEKGAKGPKVLMLGPARGVRGGISAVVNGYYAAGLQDLCRLTYLATMRDGGKIKKLAVCCFAYARFALTVRRCDIVHVHVAAQNSFRRKSLFIRLAKRAGKRIVMHVHAADFHDFFETQCDDLQRQKIRRVFAMANIVIALSEEWRDYYASKVCPPEKIRIVHNAVEIPPSGTADYRSHCVLFLGKLGMRKGVYDLLKAIPDVLARVPDAQFYLCGDGEVEKCAEIASELGISENVHLPGWVGREEKDRYIARCGVLALPSYREGMPMSILEAMAHGLAVVSTNAGGIPQLIEDGVNGFRIEAGDINALAATLIKLLVDDELKREIGARGRATVMRGNCIARMPQRLMALYDEFTITRPTPGRSLT